MTNEMVVCSNGHRFPINQRKHPTRTHVHCPKCKEKIQIRKRRFRKPNIHWPKIKQDQRDQTLEEKWKRRKHKPTPMFMRMHQAAQARAVASILALAQAKKRRKEVEDDA